MRLRAGRGARAPAGHRRCRLSQATGKKPCPLAVMGVERPNAGPTPRRPSPGDQDRCGHSLPPLWPNPHGVGAPEDHHASNRRVETRGRPAAGTVWAAGQPTRCRVDDCHMDTIRVRLRDKAGAVVATIEVPADKQRVEHEGRWYRRGGGGSSVGGDPVLLSFHEESADE